MIVRNVEADNLSDGRGTVHFLCVDKWTTLHDDSSIGCGFLESHRSVTFLMLWNLVNLIGRRGPSVASLVL